ncbi:MAG: cobalamin-dependent protein [Ignavibacteria bacterium]|jgi:methylmalonyl-CoA mutase cobalamin-binding subunit|nr:cobalamin-dependent protein [Ignavibacteria bacterium]MDH7527687.1 cobalamin-dependent protein [Ignavibacteria bacterium]
MKKRILCVPLDPVHDVGIKIIKNELDKRGYLTELLPPDLPLESIVKIAAQGNYDFILVSRTIGYGVAEMLARFIDMLDAAGVREKSKIVIGGKPITPELAAELGFDKGFGEHSTIEDLISYIEGKEVSAKITGLNRNKKDITSKYDYKFLNKEIEELLEIITDKFLKFISNKTSAGIERAKIREEIFQTEDEAKKISLKEKYLSYCDTEIIRSVKDKHFIKNVREVTSEELEYLKNYLSHHLPLYPKTIQHNEEQPIVFKFLGSGCPIMDLIHGKICERYGINGFLIINPSWEARYEGLLEGYLTHENDGTITSFDNVKLIRDNLDKSTLLSIRAHRGLNTPETVLIAGEANADLVKINLVYGSLGAGTDPLRLAVDGVEAIKLAAKYNLPFDIPGNDELSGVPAYKTLAGLLINLMIGIKLNAKPILKPLFCYGPHIVINDLMKQNFIDYNAAKIFALRQIVNAPIWPGEPIAFMTQSEERVQSANSTSYHAALAASLKVDAITVASTDEAYSRGPIAITSRIDTINAVSDAFKFIGNSGFQPTPQAQEFTEDLIKKITNILKEVSQKENLPQAIYDGVLGNKEDGAYPGIFGRGTVKEK